MNHAGYRQGARKANALRKELPELVEKVENFVLAKNL
jgi:hypothetical protein